MWLVGRSGNFVIPIALMSESCIKHRQQLADADDEVDAGRLGGEQSCVKEAARWAGPL
jgi:hypothetical protein